MADQKQFTVVNPSGSNYFVFSHEGQELEDFRAWCMKHGVDFRESTQEEKAWYDDPEFKMDGDHTDEPCFDLVDEVSELMMSIKDW